MNICLLARACLLHHHGGMPDAVSESCNALYEAGNEVTLITCSVQDSPPVIIKNGVIYLCLEGTDFHSYDGFYEKSLATFKIHHARKPFEAIISHSNAGKALTIYGDIPKIIVSHGTSLAHIQTEINMMFAGRRVDNGTILKKVAELKELHDLFNSFDGAVALAPSELHDLDNRLQIRNARMIPNPTRQMCRGSGKGSAVLCLEDKIIKGSQYINQILPNEQVIIIGQKKPLKRPCQNVGFIDNSQVIHAIARGDVFIDLAIHYSGSNTTVGKALSCGLPVVGFQTPTMDLPVKHGAGISVPIGDITGMNYAVNYIRENYGFYSDNALKLWENHYSPKAYSEGMIDFINFCRSRICSTK